MSRAGVDESSPAIGIYRQFRALIVSGQLGANERLPTVRQIAVDLGVAQGTAAKAFKLLEHDGLVVTRTAAGTRVAESAGLLPMTVIRQIRELVEVGVSNDADMDDVINVLRLTWQTESLTDPEVSETAEESARSTPGGSTTSPARPSHR